MTHNIPGAAGTRLSILEHVRAHPFRLAVTVLLLIGSVLLQLLVPQLLRDFIDAAMVGQTMEYLRDIAMVFLMAAIGKQLLGAAATYGSADFGWRLTNGLRSGLARHVFGLDLEFHKSTTPGNLIERIDGDLTALGNFMSQFATKVFGAGLLLAGVLILLWQVSPVFGAGLAAFTAIEVVIILLTRKTAVPATMQERESSAGMFSFIEERLAGLDDIRANGGGPHSLHRFNAVMRDYYESGVSAWMQRMKVWLSSYGIYVLGFVFTTWVMVLMVQRGTITVGTGFMIYQYLFMLQNQIEIITNHMQDLQKAAAGLTRVRQLAAEESRLAPAGSRTLPKGPLRLELDDVTFRYPARGDLPERTTLDGVKLDLQPGETLGLLGRTGSGKTTITRLLFRFYDPTEGEVRLGGIPLQQLSQTGLAAGVGLVTQDVQLFQATVRDNLTFFQEGARTDAELRQLLSDVGLGTWLKALPDGLDSRIGAGGSNLSAGEAQLLALARVFLKDPGLVILDEPTSRLDPETEAALQRSLDRLLAGRTAIIIAHRLQTVDKADRIMVLDDGRVAELGRRTELAADPGSHYARLLSAAGAGQTLDELLGSEEGDGS